MSGVLRASEMQGLPRNDGGPDRMNHVQSFQHQERWYPSNEPWGFKLS